MTTLRGPQGGYTFGGKLQQRRDVHGLCGPFAAKHAQPGDAYVVLPGECCGKGRPKCELRVAERYVSREMIVAVDENPARAAIASARHPGITAKGCKLEDLGEKMGKRRIVAGNLDLCSNVGQKALDAITPAVAQLAPRAMVSVTVLAAREIGEPNALLKSVLGSAGAGRVRENLTCAAVRGEFDGLHVSRIAVIAAAMATRPRLVWLRRTGQYMSGTQPMLWAAFESWDILDYFVTVSEMLARALRAKAGGRTKDVLLWSARGAALLRSAENVVAVGDPDLFESLLGEESWFTSLLRAAA